MNKFEFNSKSENSLEEEDNKEKRELIEARAEKKKVEARAEILARHNVLYISCVAKGAYDKAISNNPKIPQEIRDRIKDSVGLDDAEWFYKGLGFEEGNNESGFSVVNAVEGEEYPDINEIAGVVIGGSPHMVSSDNYPWMQDLEEYIKLAAYKGVPILGVCFGHQMVAKAFGGKVEKTEQREFGTVQVDLTEEGARDALFTDLPRHNLSVQMSHSDSVTDIDANITRVLSVNEHNRNQALAIGENIRTVQFHPELEKDILEAVAHLRREGMEEEGLDVDKILENLKGNEESNPILKNFYTYFVLKYLNKDK